MKHQRYPLNWWRNDRERPGILTNRCKHSGGWNEIMKMRWMNAKRKRETCVELAEGPHSDGDGPGMRNAVGPAPRRLFSKNPTDLSLSFFFFFYFFFFFFFFFFSSSTSCFLLCCNSPLSSPEWHQQVPLTTSTVGYVVVVVVVVVQRS